MTVIAHNIAAMNAQRQFNICSGSTKKVVEKLSSGYQINRAADNAAGLSISEKMRRQIRGLTQGVKNTQDGVSLCQVADGALAEVNDMLHRITELSIKSANGTNSASERSMIQDEINQILREIDRISNTTEFNSQPIFKDEVVVNNSETVVDQVPLIQNTIKVSSDGFVGSDTGIKGTGTISADETGISCNNYVIPWNEVKNANGDSISDTPIKSGDYSFTLYEKLNNYVDLKVDFSVNDGASLQDVITAIDGMTYEITPKNYSPVTFNTIDQSVGTKTDDFYSNFSKKSFIADENGLSIDGYGSMTWAQMGIDVNNPSGQTGTFTDNQSGISFEFSTVQNTNMDDIISAFNKNGLKSDYYYNNKNQFYADNYETNASDSNFKTSRNAGSLSLSAMNALGYMTPSGLLNANLTMAVSGSTESDLKLTITADNGNSIDIAYSQWVQTDAAVPGQQALYGPCFESQYGYFDFRIMDMSKVSSSTPSADMLSFFGNIGTIDSDFTIIPYRVYTDRVKIPNGADTKMTLSPYDKKETASTEEQRNYKNRIWIQSGCDAGDGIYLEIDRMSTRTLGINVLDVSTIRGSEKAMDMVNVALQRLTENRCKIGAQQNRLEHTIANEENIVENTTAAESRIRDADMAELMVEYSINNILMQSGEAMMAQANQSKQGILSLLNM